MDTTQLLDIIDTAGTIGLLVLIVAAFLREWVVTGVQYRRTRERLERIEDENRALLTALERATLAAEHGIQLAGGRIPARQ